MRSILFIHSWKRFWDKSSNETTYSLRPRIRKSCRIQFLTPFCNQKRYFAFFSFWLDKMAMTKNSKWNHPQYLGHGSENLVGLNFLPLFVTKHCIFCFSAFGSIKRPWVKKTIETTHNLAAADREICVIEFLSPRYDLKQYSRLLAFIWGH